LLSQQIYYAVAFAQWPHKDIPTVAVPSGNFGNLCAGLVAQASGLPIAHFIAACNHNAVFPNYLDTGNYVPHTAIPTISNAMDVGNPSNVVRIQELFEKDLDTIKNKISGYSISDEQTKETIASVYNQHNYLLDPHGAVAFAALNKNLSAKPNKKGLILATAHPVKFPETVESATNTIISIPSALKKIMKKEKQAKTIMPDYECFKQEISLLCN
jgi:threonine synthase